MKITDFAGCPKSAEPVCLTIGKFDGLHLGHQRLIKEMHKTDLPLVMLSVCITGAPELLTQKESAMAAETMGIASYLRLPLTKNIKEMSPEAFLREICV